VVAEAKTREDFSIERTLLARAQATKGLTVHPDKVPNWMRGFYDDFHEGDKGLFYPVAEKVLGNPPEHHDEQAAIERSHHYRGLGGQFADHEELVREDPYQRTKSHR